MRTRSASSASSRDHRAAVAEGAEVLRGVEGERRERAERARPRAVGGHGARGLRGVLDDRHARAPRSRATGATLPKRSTATTAFVRGVSAARTVSAVTQHVSRVDVAEDRHGARRRDRLGARVEGEGGHDDLVARADAERAQRDRDRLRPVGHADGVRGAEPPRELALEGLDLGAEDELPAVDDALDRGVSSSARSGRSGDCGSKSGTVIGGEE